MATFFDTDELRAFLKRIETYAAFWDAKEPTFSDAVEKAFWDERIRQGADPTVVLDALKAGEVWAFVREKEKREDHRLH